MRLPASTYRLQLRAGFGFERGRARSSPYLAALGVGDVYASPILAATPGSAARLRRHRPAPRRRADAGRRARGSTRLVRAQLRGLGMGLVLDIVPNHMAASEQNRWWWDVLLRGRGVRMRRVFDIDWDAPGAGGKLLLPVLGGPLDEAIDAGELTVELEDPRGAARLLRARASRCAPETDAGRPTLELLAAQHYRLADWRDAPRPTQLPALLRHRRPRRRCAVEDAGVFAATHAEILALVRDGVVDGPPHRPRRRAARPGRLPRAAARRRDRRHLRGGGEDPGPGRGAARRTGRSPGRPATTSSPWRAASSSTPTGQRACTRPTAA